MSDRWHLTKNLATCVSVVLAQILAELRRAEQAATKSGEEGKEPGEERRPARTRAVQQAQLARQSERMARYEQITALHKQDMKSADIAAQTGMTERTVRRWRETVETSLILAHAGKDPVSLIPTRPTCFRAGTRVVTRERNWKEK